MSTTLDPTARERVRAARLSVDAWAILLAVVLAVAVAAGVLPSVPW